jgi:NAD(P)-dependent dehydrogenase (short-subunit alcohol dehydrogenase family)
MSASGPPIIASAISKVEETVMGVLDGKVLIITGGGRGIGRECALLAAKEGAKVLVNDLGASLRGDDAGSAGPAEEVANEINAKGGKAIFNSDSVTNYDACVDMREQALKELGGLHGVINPAGILRDGMFHKMAEADWDAVIAVHLKGSYNISRATVELFREQEDGVYVFFSSTSGLIGNIGQTNYGAAKMGIAGLSRIIAMEGAQKNVRSNALAPVAQTRMTDSIPIKDPAMAERRRQMAELNSPAKPAQIAVALASPLAKNVSGQVFGAGGNNISLYSQPRPIASLTKDAGWTPATIINEAFKEWEPKFTPLGRAPAPRPAAPAKS